MALSAPYTPSAPPSAPADLPRATWDEFYRLQQILEALDRPANSTVNASEPVIVGPTVLWDRLFDQGLIYEYEQPPGQTDPLTGIWTCPQEGLYQVTGIVEVPALPTPQVKIYTASLRLTYTPPGGPAQTRIATVGGADTVPLRLVMLSTFPILQGATIFHDLDLTHQNVTGTVAVFAGRSILRVSGYK